MPTPSSLDLLILALAQRESVTAYILKARADISVAAAIPALKRLQQSGLLAMTAGTRKSRRYQLSPKGRRILQREITSLDQHVPDDFESVLRVASVLRISQPRRVTRFLALAAETWRKRSVTPAPRKPSGRSSSSGGLVHRWMKEIAAIDRSKAEMETLERLRKLL